MDASYSFEPGSLYQTEAAHHSLRFFNCDMFYKEPHIAILLRALQQSTCRERQIFFERVIGCRRRMSRKWEETPLAKLFTLPDEYHLLKQRAQSVRIREAVKRKGLLLFDAFRMFDTSRNGLITPAELWGAFDWLKIDAAAEDILDFIRTADKNKDGCIDYREFVEMVRDPDAKLEDLDKESESDEIDKATSSILELGSIQPKGHDELKELQEKQQVEQKRIEEEEMEREREFEQKILREITEEEEALDLIQEGGPNPKMIGDGCLKYDFTTGRRPLRMTTRGDIGYKDELDLKYLKVYSLSMLFLPIPFAQSKINQYTVTMVLMIDQRPQGLLALFNTALYNEKPANIYLSSEGKLGLRDQIPRDEGNSLLPGKWHVVSLSVDTTAGTIIIYIDGKLASTVLSPEIAVPDGNFSVYQQVCLFGSKDASETIGGNIKSFYFEDRVFGPADAQGLYESLQLESSWECEQCTFCNPSTNVECSVCGQVNSIKAASRAWICTICTFSNTTGGDICAVCEAPRPTS